MVSSAFLLLLLAASPSVASSKPSPRFYDDDPISREPETQDASKVEEWEIDLAADLLVNLFSRPGDPTPNVRARNITTIDEVPDSSWFTNRIYTTPVTTEELVRGPNTIEGPAPGRWTVIRPKIAGFAPGFTVRDEKGEVWFITLDPKRFPNAATGAVSVASRIFWALGYNQVESYISRVRLENLAIADTAMIPTRYDRRRPMTMRDVEGILESAARSEDGSYRVLAGRAVPGKILGGFRYHGRSGTASKTEPEGLGNWASPRRRAASACGRPFRSPTMWARWSRSR